MAGRRKKPLEHPAWFTSVACPIVIGPLPAAADNQTQANPAEVDSSAAQKPRRRSRRSARSSQHIPPAAKRRRTA
jgi:hypothetical protein